MHEQTLIGAGLTKDQAALYELLLKHGKQTAGKIALRSPLKRGLVYKVLDQLVGLGLVEKIEHAGQITQFKPGHPGAIKEILEKQKTALAATESALESTLGQLVSDYNLLSGKPNVQFFEGLDGIKRVLDDSLRASEEIYTYADLESIDRYIRDINKAYAARRDKLGIKKRGIVIDSPFTRKFLADYHTAVTDTRLIKTEAVPFQTVMQIYNNKISYITLSEENLIGVIIEDPRIYTMHRYLFEYAWQQAAPIKPEVQTPRTDDLSLGNSA